MTVRLRDEEPWEAELRSPVAAPYSYDDLSSGASFRVAELLPGEGNDTIACRLHAEEWDQSPQYDALSYAWGDPHDRTTILCDGRRLRVTKSLYLALANFRDKHRSRIIWADGLCINQENVPERGLQVKQMKQIYERAQHVLVWLGPDDETQQAEAAIKSVHLVSDFLCKKLDISIWHHKRQHETYQEMILKHRDKLPLPDEIDVSSEVAWQALVWLYSRKYFTRVWAIQEVTANARCAVHVGRSSTSWNCIDLVACYMIMDSTFSNQYGFSKSYCWYVASFAELMSQPKRWLNMLYLASNYSCLDARDVIYGLRGLMELDEGGDLLIPDYSKTTEAVYRDCVEAALINFKTTDVLLYVTGIEKPSWIPRWDVPMLFRNPFRFGKPVAWKPAGDTHAKWSIDKATNTLSLTGHIVATIRSAEGYNQLWFADGTIDDKAKHGMLRESWTNILHMLGESQGELPLPSAVLTAAAMALAFGMDHKLGHSAQSDLLLQLVSYLALILKDDEDVVRKYVPEDLLSKSKEFTGREFGKPVWDFQYPPSSLFVTKDSLIGCAIAPVATGDEVFIAAGSSYPVVLRSISGRSTGYTIRGFSYVDGVMHGERTSPLLTSVEIF